jgi:hypothetical protein
MAKINMANNDLHNITQKTKDQAELKRVIVWTWLFCFQILNMNCLLEFFLRQHFKDVIPDRPVDKWIRLLEYIFTSIKYDCLTE